ncbi:hypothetical protein AALG83_07025 [Christensenellaceae bacterium 44-20]
MPKIPPPACIAAAKKGFASKAENFAIGNGCAVRNSSDEISAGNCKLFWAAKCGGKGTRRCFKVLRGRKAALSWKNSIKKFFGKKSNWPQKPHDKEEQSYLVWTFLECYAIINPPASKIKDFERGPDSLNCALLCFTAALKEEASWRLHLCGIIFLRRRPKQSFGRLREHWTMALPCFAATQKKKQAGACVYHGIMNARRVERSRLPPAHAAR